MHPDARLFALIGDLTELSTALAELHRDADRVNASTLAVCEHFEHTLRFDRLTNNLRDGWRLSEAAGLHGCVSSPPTADEVRAAAPFARLLAEADNLLGVTWECEEPDTDEGELDFETTAALFAELREVLASTVAALARLIADLFAGRVTLPPFLEGDELAAAEAEGETLVNRVTDVAAAALAAAGDA
jgi:hypothetical protein